MRSLFALLGFLVAAFASPAIAGMRLTLVMVAPDQVPELSRDEKALSELLFGGTPDARLEMDKEWHGIQFLLNGDPWSTRGTYGLVIFGGKEIGADLGYGPARVLTPRQVKDIASNLETLPIEQLRRRYDPKAMTRAEIYPGVWEREGPQALEWLLVGYRKLVDFYARAAAQGKAVILAIV
jgi:hypothetical protein